MSEFLSFRLPEDFVNTYSTKKPNWGFDIGNGNSLGEIVFFNNYSRVKEDGTKERWHETCRRVVEGYTSLLKDHCLYSKTPWNEYKALATAKDAYDRMFEFKWLPPGRGLWAMGTHAVNGERNSAMLYNCAVLSTGKISSHSAKSAVFPFVRLMEMSMNGIGVGFDTRGAGNLQIHAPNPEKEEVFTVPDTREGWAESLGVLLESFFFENRATVKFDYSQIRPSGAPLKRFGGTASGPEPLMRMHERVTELLALDAGREISSQNIVDIMNLAAKAVVAGGSRRSALLALGEPDDKEFINLKNYEVYPERNGEDGWAYLSNNSVIAEVGGNYDHLVDLIADNGEPGVLYLDMARNYGRTGDAPDYKDQNVMGTNPCGEIFLESSELCNLSELFPNHHEDINDFKRSIKHAYMYNKAVTLLPTPWPETNEVINRNRRIGLSVSGSVQFLESKSHPEYKQWLEEAYAEVLKRDVQYSAWLGIRESIRHTTSKPSGSVSILAGATPGVHWPTNNIYIRRMRMRADSDLLLTLIKAGYQAEPDVMDPANTWVVELPVLGPNVRTERDVTIWEKASVAALVQKHFADNAVSCTITFKETEKEQIGAVLRTFEGQLKSISFLPIYEGESSYAQMPYEAITLDEHVKLTKKIKPLNWDGLYDGTKNDDALGEKFCSNDTCTI